MLICQTMHDEMPTLPPPPPPLKTVEKTNRARCRPLVRNFNCGFSLTAAADERYAIRPAASCLIMPAAPCLIVSEPRLVS